MRKNGHKTVHKTYINTLGVPHSYSHGYFLFILHWTEHPGIWYHDLWSTTVRIRVIIRLRISTSPLFTCCWMSFKVVLGNKEFEFVVFGVTLAVVTRRSVSGHGVSVLNVGDRWGWLHLIPLFFLNSLKKSKISSGNSCNYCINNVQTLGFRVYKQILINFR